MQENLLIPLLYELGLMSWEDVAFGWALFAMYGAAQVALTLAVCVPLERWRPVESWPDSKAVAVDVLYTLLSRVGLLPLVSFVLFYRVQVALTGWLTDQGWTAPTLERLFPVLYGQQIATFLLYAIILDFADYWRHRLSHAFRWWYALHSVHHAQRQMTFWSDDRNHALDDLIAVVWFGAIALAVGVPPAQFPLLVLALRFVESLSHANTRVSFGWLGDRLMVSPRFHRAHHGVAAAGRVSRNYGSVLPWWDMAFGTADFAGRAVATGDPSAEEAMATGGWWDQQAAGIRRMLRASRTGGNGYASGG